MSKRKEEKQLEPLELRVLERVLEKIHTSYKDLVVDVMEDASVLQEYALLSCMVASCITECREKAAYLQEEK